MEIEPWAMKTLLLLQSSTEDAPYKLREMLVETIQQKYGGRRPCRPVPPVPSSWLAEFRAKKHSNHDSDEFMKKIMQADSPAPPTPDSNLTDTTTESTIESNEDVTIELVEEGLSCAVCCEVGFNAYELMECAECHSHYHKQCHSPPIPDRDVSDPRFVWYCRRCARTNKVNTVAVGGQINNIKQNNKPTSMKTAINLMSTSSFFNKHFGGSFGTSNKKTACGKYSTQSVVPSVKTAAHAPNMNIISADRRLQIMKKKAAKKQDKRVITK
ncbi:integrator complex subunit 12-like [Rhodnius prolixus]